MYSQDEEEQPAMLQLEDITDDSDYGEDMIVPELPHAEDTVDGDNEDGFDKYLTTEVIFDVGGELKDRNGN